MCVVEQCAGGAARVQWHGVLKAADMNLPGLVSVARRPRRPLTELRYAAARSALWCKNALSAVPHSQALPPTTLAPFVDNSGHALTRAWRMRSTPEMSVRTQGVAVESSRSSSLATAAEVEMPRSAGSPAASPCQARQQRDLARSMASVARCG